MGDLGTIDDKYDVAISTACGKLNYLVANTMEDGEKILNFLRHGNIGRVDLIIVEKVIAGYKQFRERQFQAPHHTQRLFDLVRMQKPELADVFYFALGNCLVADTL